MDTVLIPFRCTLTDDFNIAIHSPVKGRVLAAYKNLEDLEVTISRKKVSKTTQQVRFWWGVIIPQVQAIILETEGTAVSRELAHLHLCTSVLNLELVEVTISGKKYIDVERFKLSKAGIGDVSAAIEKVVQHYALLGFVIETSVNNNYQIKTWDDVKSKTNAK